MKQLTAAALAKINLQTGNEPVTLLKIEFGPPFNTHYYADRDVSLNGFNWEGRIVSIANIASVKNQTSGTMNSVAVTLDDVNKDLFAALDTTVICAKKVTVYEWFAGTAFADLIPLLVGEISTPLSWKESDRTLSFEINTKIRSLQAGYRPFDGVQQDIIGKSMPLCYGTVFDIPCQALVNPRKAVLFDDVLYNDDNPYITGTKSFRVVQNLYWADNVTITLLLGTLKVSGHFVGNTFYIDEKKIEHLTFQSYDPVDPHRIYVTLTTTNVVGKKIQVNQYEQFSSTRFYQQQYNVITQTYYTDALGVRYTCLILDHPITQVASAADQGLQSPGQSADILILPTLFWFTFKAGTTIYQDGFTSTTLCFNAIPSTRLLSVQAYKSVGTNARTERDLVQLDSSYYTSNLNYSFNGQHISIITLLLPLSYYQQGWEDTVYVSLVSSVGPNTADIIKDIVTRYTPLLPDITSFTQVHNYLVNYPSNFAIFDTKDALTFIGEICWQARCSYDVIAGIVYLKYLSLEPSSSLNITDDDIIEASTEVGYTKFEDIITQLVAKFKLSYAQGAIEQRLVFNNNQALYGLKRLDYDFYIYTVASLVQKSLTFWGNRYSNQWRELYLKTPLKGLLCDVFDCNMITTDGRTTKGIVDEADYDTKMHMVSLRYWLPIIAGTNTQSKLAWLTDTLDVPPPAPIPPLLNMNSVIVEKVGDWSWRQNQQNVKGGWTVGKVVSVNTDYTFIADIYDDGFEYPPTAEGVFVDLLDHRYKHQQGQRCNIRTIGGKYYSDHVIRKHHHARIKTVTKNDDGSVAYTADIYRNGYTEIVQAGDEDVQLISISDAGVYEEGDDVIAYGSRDDTPTDPILCSAKGTGDITIAGDKETVLIDGSDPTGQNAAFFSDIFEIVDSVLRDKNKKLFTLAATTGDYLVASDGTKIAKSYYLRESTFASITDADGTSYVYTSDTERTATGADGSTEDQIVYPAYQIGDLIYATKGIIGGTGVIDVVDGVNKDIGWLDSNNDARAWYKAP